VKGRKGVAGEKRQWKKCGENRKFTKLSLTGVENPWVKELSGGGERRLLSGAEVGGSSTEGGSKVSACSNSKWTMS